MISAVLAHRRRIGYALSICAVSLIACATLLPSSQQLSSATWCIVCGNLGGVDVVLNVLLFAPLGLGLGLAGVHAPRAIAAMCVCSLSIEFAQLLIPGRDSSLGDLIMNSCGGACGFGVGVLADRLLQPTRRAALLLGIAWLGVWLALRAASGALLIPDATDLRYFGQIRRALGGRAPFSGDVISASMNERPIPNTAFRNSNEVARAINTDDGVLFDLVVVPRERQHGLTSIVRIVDGKFDEIALLARDGPDFVFGVRNQAANLRLRPLYFALRDVFSPEPRETVGTDTLRFRARYSRGGVTLSVEQAGSLRQSFIPLTPSLAWRLLMPAPSYADGSSGDGVADAIWTTLWLVPVAFWFVIALGSTPKARRK